MTFLSGEVLVLERQAKKDYGRNEFERQQIQGITKPQKYWLSGRRKEVVVDCGNCTLCCKLLETHGIQSKLGEWCKYCNPSKGCSIYTTRPTECREYLCMWVQMEKVGKELRPDMSHIIFEKLNGTIILGLQDPDYELTTLAKKQIASFVRDGFSVALVKGKQKGIHLAKGHNINEVGRTINDRSKLYRRLN